VVNTLRIMHGVAAFLHNPECVVLSFLFSDSDISCHFMRYGLMDCDVVEDVNVRHVLSVH
jgi:hypothetical protein